MATIKRSELDALRARVSELESQHLFLLNADSLLSSENDVLADWYVAEKSKVENLRTKLWDAEQEIHDLKQYVEKCDNLRFAAEKQSKEFQEALQILAQQHVNLMVDYLKLVNATQVVHIANKDAANAQQQEDKQEPEQITPPPCLKPLDAMKWNEQVVTGSITYRG